MFGTATQCQWEVRLSRWHSFPILNGRGGLVEETHNRAVDHVPFGEWMLRNEAAQRRPLAR